MLYAAPSSSADIVADIFRLIPRNERAAFGEMLEHELRGRELPDHELRRVAENVWRPTTDAVPRPHRGNTAHAACTAT